MCNYYTAIYTTTLSRPPCIVVYNFFTLMSSLPACYYRWCCYFLSFLYSMKLSTISQKKASKKMRELNNNSTEDVFLNKKKRMKNKMKRLRAIFFSRLRSGCSWLLPSDWWKNSKKKRNYMQLMWWRWF